MGNRQSQRGRGGLRLWLVLFNLLFLATPSVALASGGGELVGHIVAGCCGAMIRGAVEGAIDSASRRERLDHRVPRQELPLGETRKERCFYNHIMQECYSLAVEIERSSASVAVKRRALIYYRKACLIGPDEAPCDHAQRLARDLGCKDVFECGGVDLSGKAPPAEACSEADQECLPPFDVDAARAAFSAIEAKLAARCVNDAPLTRSVRVSVLFEPNGWAAGVWMDPELKGSHIAACIEDEFFALGVPPFRGKEVAVVKTVSLLDVPIYEQLVNKE